jgi:DNA mismatch endonuclease, patch repair protein
MGNSKRDGSWGLSRSTDRQRLRRVRGYDTTPELVVRKLVHSLGYRFRLYRRDLPGNPDLAFPGRRKVVFVHGCFWHRHDCRRGRSMPTANGDLWELKFRNTVERDRSIMRRLRREGWEALVVWECQLSASQRESLIKRMRRFLG